MDMYLALNRSTNFLGYIALPEDKRPQNNGLIFYIAKITRLESGLWQYENWQGRTMTFPTWWDLHRFCGDRALAEDGDLTSTAFVNPEHLTENMLDYREYWVEIGIEAMRWYREEGIEIT